MLAAGADRARKWEVSTAKGYWRGCIRKVFDQAKSEAYQKLARPALDAGGRRCIVRGQPAKAQDA
jgi:hypothetical protein